MSYYLIFCNCHSMGKSVSNLNLSNQHKISKNLYIIYVYNSDNLSENICG